jgi:glycosyltransferase involved in cell wall biosynthesis
MRKPDNREAIVVQENSVPKICYPYVGPDIGGSHISSVDLIKNIDRTRYEPIVVLQQLHGPIYDMFRDEGLNPVEGPQVSIHALPGNESGLSLMTKAIRSLPSAIEYLKTLGAVIVHGNDGRTNAIWGPPTKLAGLKLVWHNRGSPRAKGLRYGAPVFADRVVSVSRFASPAPGMISASNKNKVIHSPFDTSLYVDRAEARAAIVSELNVSDKTKFVGYFGWMIERKRPLLFIDMIAELRDQHPDSDVRGLIFGEGEPGTLAQVKERIAERNIADRVILMGFRKRGAFWIGGCDALAVPAVDEPFGRTIIEAMLTGTPVIATLSGGNPEAIRDGETGVLVPAEDAKALANGVWSVISNPKFAETLSENARVDAKSRFGIKTHAEAVMRIYDELIGGSDETGD